MVFKIEGNVPDTVILGNIFILTYYISGNLGYSVDIRFPHETKGFGIPLLINEATIADWTSILDNGDYISGQNGQFRYAFTPTITGELIIPQASVEIKGKEYRIDEHKIVVMPPERPLRDTKAKVIIPKSLKERDKFDLKVLIEGNCPESFDLFLPKLSWAKDVTDSNYPSRPVSSNKDSLKHEYTFRMRATKAGEYTFPHVIIWIPEDKTHFLADHIENVIIEENHTDPREVVISSVLPDTVIVGQPFTFHYLLSSSYDQIEHARYADNHPEGFDLLKSPVTKYLDRETIYLNNNPDKYYTIYEIALVNQNRASQAGQLSFPPLTIAINGKEYVTDPVTITAIPAEKEQEIKVKITKQVPQKVVKGEDFWIEALIETYSGYLDVMQMDLEKFEKRLSKDFTLIDKQVVKDKRSSERNYKDRSLSMSTYNQYRWKLNAETAKKVVLPELPFSIYRNKYKVYNDTLTVLSTPSAQDIEIIINATGTVNTPFSIGFRAKNGWDIRSVNFPDLAQPGFDKPTTDPDLVVREASFDEYFITPRKTGELVIPPVQIHLNVGSFYTDPIPIKILPEE